MYVKIIGALLILVSSAAMGMNYGRNLRIHLEELRYLRQIFLMLAGQLKYTKDPIPDVFLETAARVKQPYAGFFREVYKAFDRQRTVNFPAWFQEEAKKCLESYRKEKRLTEEEWDLFLSLGEQTGYMDVEMQIGMLLSGVEDWDRKIRKTEEEIGPKQRIGNCLGVLLGVFLTVLFF